MLTLGSPCNVSWASALGIHRQGSEVHLMVQAHHELAASGVKVRRGPLVPQPPWMTNGEASIDHLGITSCITKDHLGITSCITAKLAGL